MKKVYYLVPDLYRKLPFSLKALCRHLMKGSATEYLKRCLFQVQKPAGGIKVIYQHCMLLRQLGIDAKPLLMGNYNGNFFHFEIPTVKYEEVVDSIGSSDIVVATEFKPYEGLLFKEATKVLFLQNWIGLIKWLEPKDREFNYLDLGYSTVITCSRFCTEYVKEHMNIPVTTITNGIDLNLFTPADEKRIPNRILAMSRKNPEDLKSIIKLLKTVSYDIKIVDGLTQEQLIDEYQSADIFLATGYPEGFSLPPLEAMACGCVVVGFSGGAGSEFMLHNETALVAEDGDCQSVVGMLTALCDNPDEKEKIRKLGIAKSLEYSLENTKKDLENFYKIKGLLND